MLKRFGTMVSTKIVIFGLILMLILMAMTRLAMAQEPQIVMMKTELLIPTLRRFFMMKWMTIVIL